jgi:hypothetical protein
MTVRSTPRKKAAMLTLPSPAAQGSRFGQHHIQPDGAFSDRRSLQFIYLAIVATFAPDKASARRRSSLYGVQTGPTGIIFPSCIRCSSVKSWVPRSDMPVLRLSNRIRRQNEARRRMNAFWSGERHSASTFETKPGRKSRSKGPSPGTWYAICTLSLRT